METKHTKEKWEIHKDEFDNSNITSNGYYIGEMRNEEDAKKVISIPDLLEALQKVKSELMYENLINKEKSSGRNWQVELDIINQAINKATE